MKSWQYRNTTHSKADFWQDRFKLFQKLLPKGKIVDIGCGAGRDAQLLRPNYDYIGIDLSPEMIIEAKKLVPSADFRVMNMSSLEFRSNEFDGFWAVASLLHLLKSRVDFALREIIRVTKLDGLGFIAVKAGQGEIMIGSRFFAFYSLAEWKEKLVSNGFLESLALN